DGSVSEWLIHAVMLNVERLSRRQAQPLRSSYGSVGERERLGVSIPDGAGASGHGEAAPLPAYDGVSLERVARALERYRRVLAGSGKLADAQVIQACRDADALPAALAAIDLALWDRAGRL